MKAMFASAHQYTPNPSIIKWEECVMLVITVLKVWKFNALTDILHLSME
jgi:hypothetical protein